MAAKGGPPPLPVLVGSAQEVERVPSTSEIQALIPPPDPIATCDRLRALPERLLLDSARGGRHSYLMADPWAVARDPHELRRLLVRRDAPGGDAAGLPPFQGGAAGLVEYGWPEDGGFRFGLYDWVIAWDHRTRRAWLVSTGQPGATPDERRRRAKARAAEVARLLGSADLPPWRPEAAPDEGARLGGTNDALSRSGAAPAAVSNFTEARYEAAVREVLDRIAAGDVEQVNLSQRFEAPSPAEPWELYLRLRAINPAPFAAFYDLGARRILSASPERFLRVEAGEAELWPIKGTRPRGRDEREDRALAEELLTSEKDRRENDMIAELALGELEPFCAAGTASVRARRRLERHPTVQHLVSIVGGRLGAGHDPLHLLEGMFPPISIAGRPRRRAMELIAAIEGGPRGPYCGSLAWWSTTGAFDSSVLIRTVVVEGDRLHFSAGGGIVHGSSPADEWAETLHKARFMLEAIGGVG